jgi:hypothetical protein
MIAALVADSLLLGAGDSADDGGAAGDAGAFLRLQPRAARPDSSFLREIDRFVDLPGLRAHLGPYIPFRRPIRHKGEVLKSPPDRRRNRYPLSSAEVLQHTIRRLQPSGARGKAVFG